VPTGIVAGDAPVSTPAPVLTVETLAANLPQAPAAKPDATGPRPATPEARATGDAVIESVRRAAGTSAAVTARQRGANGDPKQDAERGTADANANRGAVRADAARPRGIAADAPVPEVADAASRADAAAAAPRAAAPVHTAAEGGATAVSGAPHDPRLASVDATTPRAGRSDQVTLRIDGDAGTEARVRLAVRGPDVRATIVADDPVLARRLEDSLGTLKQALGDRGFERTQVVVQSTTGSRHDSANDASRDPRHPQRDAQEDAEAGERKHGRPEGDAQSRRRGQGRERNGRRAQRSIR
jgi:hypothetical protein